MGDEAAKRFFGDDYPEGIRREGWLELDSEYFSVVKDGLCDFSLLEIAGRMYDAYFAEMYYPQKNWALDYSGVDTYNTDRMKDIFFFCQSNRIAGQDPFAAHDSWAIDVLKRLKSAFTSYAAQATDDEMPVYLYDNSAHKPKDGKLLVTTENFYSSAGYVIPITYIMKVLPNEQFFSRNMDLQVDIYKKGYKTIVTMSASNGLHHAQIWELSRLLALYCWIRSYMPEERLQSLQGIAAGNIRGLNF